MHATCLLAERGTVEIKLKRWLSGGDPSTPLAELLGVILRTSWVCLGALAPDEGLVSDLLALIDRAQ